MTNFVIFIKEMLSSYPVIAPIFALIGGIIASFSPCSLSSIPLLLGYIGKDEPKNKIKLLTLFFIIGNSIVFVLLGIFSTYLSSLTFIVGKWWYIVLSLILIIMVLELWNITHIFSKTRMKLPKKGKLGAFATGAISGIMASPCSTPILIMVLTIASTKSTIYGAILLLFYAIGHNALVVISVLINDKVFNIKKNKKYKYADTLVNLIFGLIILSLGFYFFYLGI